MVKANCMPRNGPFSETLVDSEQGVPKNFPILCNFPLLPYGGSIARFFSIVFDHFGALQESIVYENAMNSQNSGK